MRHDEQYQLNRIFMRSSEWRWTNMRIIGTSVEFSYSVFWNGVYGDGRNKMGKFADAKLRHEQSRKIGIRKKRKKNNGQVQLGSHRKRERETRKKSKDAVRNARNSNEKSFLQMHSTCAVSVCVQWKFIAVLISIWFIELENLLSVAAIKRWLLFLLIFLLELKTLFFRYPAHVLLALLVVYFVCILCVCKWRSSVWREHSNNVHLWH